MGLDPGVLGAAVVSSAGLGVCTRPAQSIRAADVHVFGPIQAAKLARKPAAHEVCMETRFVQIHSQQTGRLWECVSVGLGPAWASRWGADLCHTGRAKREKTNSVNSRQNCFA